MVSNDESLIIMLYIFMFEYTPVIIKALAYITDTWLMFIAYICKIPIVAK